MQLFGYKYWNRTASTTVQQDTAASFCFHLNSVLINTIHFGKSCLLEWRPKSSAILNRVVWPIITGISKENCVFTFRFSAWHRSQFGIIKSNHNLCKNLRRHLPGCYAVQTDTNLPTFLRNPSEVYKYVFLNPRLILN